MTKMKKLLTILFSVLMLSSVVLARDWQDLALLEQNKLRFQHGSPPLLNSQELNKSAQKCADYLAQKMIFNHVCGSVFGFPYGENLAQASFWNGPEDAVLSAVKMWYDEADDHSYIKNKFQFSSGHFSQLVWKTSKRFGVGYAENDDFKIVVGHYDPPGNMDGFFKENVKRPLGSITIGQLFDPFVFW